MSKYTGKKVTANRSAQDIYNKLTNLQSLQERINQLPAEAQAKLGEVKFESDRIVINAPMVGELAFVATEHKEPTHITMSAVNAPVTFNIHIDLEPVDDNSCTIAPTLEADIPMMLKPMVGGKLQEAADKFSEMIGGFFIG